MAPLDQPTENQYTPSSANRNITYLYIEIAFASILGAIVTFNSAFAIRLGASDALIAALNSAPFLLAALASIPSARFLARRTNRKLWLLGTLFISRLGMAVVALLPILVPDHKLAAFWIVIWIIFLNVPAVFFQNGFQVLLGDLIPEHRRAYVISRRQVIWSVGIVIVSVLGGVWLDRVAFPQNYELLYLFGFVTVLGSQFFLQRLVVPTTHRFKQRIDLPMADLLDEPVTMRAPMRNFLINIIVYQFGLSIPAALFNIYYIQYLSATDGWIGLNGGAIGAGVIVGYILWERILRRRSFLWVQRRATLLTWIYPFILALIPNLTVIMLFNFIVNVMHSGVDLSNFNVLLRVARPHERSAYVSWYNTAVNVSTFAAPLFGTTLAIVLGNRYGIQIVLMISATVRIIGGILFNTNRVEESVATSPTA